MSYFIIIIIYIYILSSLEYDCDLLIFTTPCSSQYLIISLSQCLPSIILGEHSQTKPYLLITVHRRNRKDFFMFIDLFVIFCTEFTKFVMYYYVIKCYNFFLIIKCSAFTWSPLITRYRLYFSQLVGSSSKNNKCNHPLLKWFDYDLVIIPKSIYIVNLVIQLNTNHIIPTNI